MNSMDEPFYSLIDKLLLERFIKQTKWTKKPQIKSSE